MNKLPNNQVKNYYAMNLNKLMNETVENLRARLKKNNPTMNFSNWNKERLVRWYITRNVTKLYVNHKGGKGVPAELAVLNKSVCRSGRLQIKGTCWFQSILNGWLLSTYGRHILIMALAKFKQSNNMKKWTNINACPWKLSGAFFWSYIEYKLKENYTNVNFNKRALQGLEFKNTRLMKNVGVAQWTANKGEQGSIALIEYHKFLNQVFPEQWSYLASKKKPILVKVYNGHSNIKQLNGYTMSHAIMTYYSKKLGGGGHSICGYICSTGTPMVYDSNNLRSFPHDWVRKNLDDYMIKRYFPEGISRTKTMEVTYIRDNLLV
jgi:hypothetical protein